MAICGAMTAGAAALAEGPPLGTAAGSGVEERTPLGTAPALAEAAADGSLEGAEGPSLMPARRGQAIPTKNPTTAMMETRFHEGREASSVGT